MISEVHRTLTERNHASVLFLLAVCFGARAFAYSGQTVCINGKCYRIGDNAFRVTSPVIPERVDGPTVKRIFFMAGSRLGKTETGLSLMQSAQDHNPDVGMIVGPTETIIE
ncbi:MAG: hypothetical protein AAFU85_27075 [Planctomycetota bacterium]